MKGSSQYHFLRHCSKDWRLRQSWMRNEEINRAKGKAAEGQDELMILKKASRDKKGF